MRTCVGILRVSIRMGFGVFLQFLFYPYNYNCELYMFDELVDVPMRESSGNGGSVWVGNKDGRRPYGR